MPSNWRDRINGKQLVRSRRAGKFRSQFEASTAAFLEHYKIPFRYEDPGDVLEYVQPATKHKYHPDFYLPVQNIYIETKGKFIKEDRDKHLWVREAHPYLDIRFVFWNSENRIYAGSKTTYGMWCNKHRFLWAERKIPKEWLWPESSSGI